MLQPHIQLDESCRAACAILPGDPGRITRIAEILEGAEELGFHREYRSIRGTWKGVPVLAMSTGWGAQPRPGGRPGRRGLGGVCAAAVPGGVGPRAAARLREKRPAPGDSGPERHRAQP